MDEGGGCGNECLYPVRFTSGSNLGTLRFGVALNERASGADSVTHHSS